MKPIIEVKYFLSNEGGDIKFELVYGKKYIIKCKGIEECFLSFIGIDMLGMFHGRNENFQIIHLQNADIISISEAS